MINDTIENNLDIESELFACIKPLQWFAVPFVVTDKHVVNIWSTFENPTMAPGGIHGWAGYLDPSLYATWCDSMLLLIFGGIPWQVRSKYYKFPSKRMKYVKIWI